VEDTPTHTNLLGTIERVVDAHGRVVIHCSRIKAGSLLHASGAICYAIWRMLRQQCTARSTRYCSKCLSVYDPLNAEGKPYAKRAERRHAPWPFTLVLREEYPMV
jgi:hypothetical protein